MSTGQQAAPWTMARIVMHSDDTSDVYRLPPPPPRWRIVLGTYRCIKSDLKLARQRWRAARAERRKLLTEGRLVISDEARAQLSAGKT